MSPTRWDEAAHALPRRVLYGEHKTDVSPDPSRRPYSFLKIYTKVLGTQLEEALEISSSTNTLGATSKDIHRLRLYKLAMNASKAYLVNINYSQPRKSRSTKAGFYIAYAQNSLMSTDLEYEDHEMPYGSSEHSTIRITLNAKAPGTQLVEVGVYCSGILESSAPLQLLAITRLSVIKAPLVKTGGYDYGVANVQIVQRGHAPHTQRRLAWEWQGSGDKWPAWLPWSATTGPFSYFTLLVNGCWLGVAYCLEFPILDGDNVGSGVELEVRGHLFGGMPIIQPAVARITL